jgi:hypothetical protein
MKRSIEICSITACVILIFFAQLLSCKDTNEKGQLTKTSDLKKIVTFARFLMQIPESKERDKNIKFPDYDAFKEHFSGLLRKMPDGHIADHKFVYLRGQQLPWIDSGIFLGKGESVTVFASGRIFYSESGNVWGDPRMVLWYRIGNDGRIFRKPDVSSTFKADNNGNLYVANYLCTGCWATDKGEMNINSKELEKYKDASGGLSLLIIKWNNSPLKGLKELKALGDMDNLVLSGINSFVNPVETPSGWNYMPEMGRSDIIRLIRNNEKQNVLRCDMSGQMGILQKDIIFPLDSVTEISWSWKISSLPSNLPEDIEPTHDYMSIAVEFENGRDITYCWSSELPEQSYYQCPLKDWENRETHVVIRSGQNNLGKWINEKRNLFNDYRSAIGTPPLKIVRVWIIANSVIQRKKGKADFADIRLIGKSKSVSIL